ncbi:hypothetical protein L6164_006853 [Bauhinia variegata]|uniref:Uncharacterized protein n=1 Tax=Bauhinia variegata TaxID=167791 RepID=A0ACB9PVW8_BAUVA|nr:hypothetical protein L6164_006853 [Bauhinia variegata]
MWGYLDLPEVNAASYSSAAPLDRPRRLYRYSPERAHSALYHLRCGMTVFLACGDWEVVIIGVGKLRL